MQPLTKNRQIQILRESTVKVTKILSHEHNIRVTQQGVHAFVEYNDFTGEPTRVNLPNIPDDASDDLIVAIQGFLDHEVGHLLYSDSKMLIAGNKAGVGQYHNILEDTYVERKMRERFQGSDYNLSNVGKFFLEHFTDKMLQGAIMSGDRTQLFGLLFVPMARAWAGQQVFIDYMDDKWDMISDFVKVIGQDIIDRIPHMDSTEETLEVAKEIKKRLEQAKPPQQPQQGESQDNNQQQQDDDNQSQDRQDENQGDESNSSEGSDESEDQEGSDGDGKENDDEDGNEGAGDSDSEEEGDGEDQKESKSDGSQGDDDEGEEDEAEDGDSGDSDSSDSGDDSDTGDEDSDDGMDSDGDNSDGGDTDDDGDPGDDSDDAGAEEDDEEGEQDGPEDEGQDQEDDQGSEGTEDDGDSDDDGDDSEGPGDQGDDGEDADGEDDAGVGDEGATEEGAELEGDRQIEIPEMQDFSLDDFEEAIEKDFDDAISEVITDMASDADRSAHYTVYTKDYDEIVPIQTVGNSFAVTEMESRVNHMIGRMTKELERAVVARTTSHWVPGQRRGKLNGNALSRLAVGRKHRELMDDRIFRKKEEHTSKNVAVSIVTDCSGSMSGRKMKLACDTAYGISSVLERLNITHEVIGFTTKKLPPNVMMEYRKEFDEGKMGQVSRLQSLYHPMFKDFNERLNVRTKERFAVYPKDGHSWTNVDGESIEMAANRLLARQEEGKIMIVLSDGAPAPGQGGKRVDVVGHTVDTIKKVEASGINIVGIGIMDSAVKDYYRKHIVLNNLEDLPTTVIGQLRRALLDQIH